VKKNIENRKIPTLPNPQYQEKKNKNFRKKKGMGGRPLREIMRNINVQFILSDLPLKSNPLM
jgi:hypothetical protein